jgi:hypothetical protein
MLSLPSPADLAQFWRRLLAMLLRAHLVTGGPNELVAGGPLPNKERRAIAAWISLLEVIVRKLICIEAAHIYLEERKAERGRGPDQNSSRATAQTPSPRGEGAGGGVNLAHGTVAAQRQDQQSRIDHIVQDTNTQHRPTPSPLPQGNESGGGDATAPGDPNALENLKRPPFKWRLPLPRAPSTRPQPDSREVKRREIRPAHIRLALRLAAVAHAMAHPTLYAKKMAQKLPPLFRAEPGEAAHYAYVGPRPYMLCQEDARLSIDAGAGALYAVEILGDRGPPRRDTS